ncbi:hypothetical protein EYF80_003536 [Liparis tanakae]|uniref:Uncharacterized protein n=1 Tax=Liparis tanakae TaxID=230148 RepID=A0A4Z2J7F4_9TELE|nr:hypothetical protein EYF80_003536 [Liparis tanakae]
MFSLHGQHDEALEVPSHVPCYQGHCNDRLVRDEDLHKNGLHEYQLASDRTVQFRYYNQRQANGNNKAFK